MERLSGTDLSVSGLRWDKFRNPNLILNPILGAVTKEEEAKAVADGWIVKRDGVWKVAKGTVTCNAKGHTFVKGYSHELGSYIDTASVNYQAYKDMMHAKDKKEYMNEKEVEEESVEALLNDIPDFN